MLLLFACSGSPDVEERAEDEYLGAVPTPQLLAIPGEVESELLRSLTACVTSNSEEEVGGPGAAPRTLAPELRDRTGR